LRHDGEHALVFGPDGKIIFALLIIRRAGWMVP
jgi:hypothetical protein